jgi:hypothetical protein
MLEDEAIALALGGGGGGFGGVLVEDVHVAAPVRTGIMHRPGQSLVAR